MTTDLEHAKEILSSYSLRSQPVDEGNLFFAAGFFRGRCEKLEEELEQLKQQYEERGLAMRETGDIVRSLYIPKIDRAQNMLNTLLNIDFEKTTNKEIIRNHIKEIKQVLK